MKPYTPNKLLTLDLSSWEELLTNHKGAQISIYRMSKPHTVKKDLSVCFLRYAHISFSDLSVKSQNKIIEETDLKELVQYLNNPFFVNDLKKSLKKIKPFLNHMLPEKFEILLHLAQKEWVFKTISHQILNKDPHSYLPKKDFLNFIVSEATACNSHHFKNFIQKLFKQLDENDCAKFKWSEPFNAYMAQKENSLFQKETLVEDKPTFKLLKL